MSIPTNISDAVASIRDGSITPKEVKIGPVVVSALTGLRTPRRQEVTRRPVQAGYSVSMGVIDVPDEIEMDIVLANPDYSSEGMVTAALTGSVSALTQTWREKRDALFSLFDTKEIVDFTTHEESYGAIYVVSEIETHYDNEEDWEGWVGTIHLIQFGEQLGDTSVDIDAAKTAADAYVGSF